MQSANIRHLYFVIHDNLLRGKRVPLTRYYDTANRNW